MKSGTKISTSHDNFYEKANVFRLENLYNEAVKNYLNAILIDRNDAKSYFELGICFKHLNRISKAIKYLEIAAKLKDDWFDVHLELGICYQLKGSACNAIKNFVRAVQINPENPDAVLQLGLSHEMCEEYDLAMMIYKKLIENSPGFIKAYDCQSALLMKLGCYREASAVLNDLLKRNPDYYKAYAGIGV